MQNSKENEMIPVVLSDVEEAALISGESFPGDSIRTESDDDLRKRIISRSKKLDTENLLLAKDLYIVFYENKFEKWGYHTFIDYVVQEVGISESMANGLRRIWKKFFKQLNVDNNKLVGVGYSRAQMILPVLDNKNVDEWVDKAKTLKLKDLRLELSKEQKRKEVLRKKNEVLVETPSERLEREEQEKLLVDPVVSPDATLPTTREDEELSPIKRSFMLYPEQMDIVNTALEVAERVTGSAKEGNNLTCALTEYLAMQISKESKIASRMSFYMKALEKLGGGKLMWIKSEKAFNLIQNFMDSNPDIFKGDE